MIDSQGDNLTYHEQDRAAALAAFDIFGTPREAEFDRLARLALNLGPSKAAWISFVGEQELYVKACEGVDLQAFCTREHTICDRVVKTGSSIEIEDLEQDREFADTALLTKFGLRSYRGVPVTTMEGHVLGTVVTMNDEPGPTPPFHMERLADIATITMRELRLRRILASARPRPAPQDQPGPAGMPQDLLRSMTREHLKILSAIKDGIIGVNRQGIVNFVNPAAEKLLGRPAGSLIGSEFREAVRAPVAGGPRSPRPCQVMASLQEGNERLVRQEAFQRGDGSAIPVEYAASPLKIGADVVGAIISFRDMRKSRGPGGIELRDALREVARLKSQIATAERLQPIRMPEQRPTIGSLAPQRLMLDLQQADMGVRIRQEEADQIMRAMMISANVIEGELGAAYLLGMDPNVLRQKLQIIQATMVPKRVSRLDRWSN